MKKGLLLVVSGPAGSGKGTVNANLINSGDFVFSVSATTRAPRPGEVDGVNYHYISREKFEEKIKSSELLEYTEYCGNYYGTLKKESEDVLNMGKNLILEIEVEGAKNIKKLYPDAILIMLLPPSFKKQEERLRGRGTETSEKIAERLERTKTELKYLDNYDYIVYNNDGGIKDAEENIKTIIRAEQFSRKRNPDAMRRYFEN